MSAAEVLMTAMMAMITVLLAGGIPWAYVIGQKVTRIEAKLSNGISDRIERHSDNLDELNTKMHVLERALETGGPEHVRRVLRESKRRKDDGGQD